MKDMVFDKRKKAFVPKPKNFNEDLAAEKIDVQKYHLDQDLIGTSEYISPEALFQGEYSPSVDLWALGCIIYLFFHGVTPFKDKNNPLIFEKIRKNDFHVKEDLSEETKDIINKLLVKDPTQRLGGGSKENKLDIEALKNHKFFENIDFENLKNQQPPINMKKIIYSKLKQNNSTDDIIGLKNIPPISNQSLFINKNIIVNKHISNQNLAMKNIDNYKEELEILYGRNTEGGDYDINKTPFNDNVSFGNPFKIIDITEECENICHHVDFNYKETDLKDEILLEGKLNYK
jgi:serine/threonine protein kinase